MNPVLLKHLDSGAIWASSQPRASVLVRRGSPAPLANVFLIHRRKQVLLVFEDVLQQLQDTPTRWTLLRDGRSYEMILRRRWDLSCFQWHWQGFVSQILRGGLSRRSEMCDHLSSPTPGIFQARVLE